MARTVLAAMAAAVPRQPAWTAPTAPVTGSCNRIGVQSAVNTARAVPGVAVIRASHSGSSGAYSPAPVVTADKLAVIKEKIIMPVVRELRKRGIVYRGTLYAGLMVNYENSNPRGPAAKSGSSANVVEFNALLHAATGCLKDEDIVVKDGCAATVIVSSGGYPGDYEKGKEISGLDAAGAGATVFHCGTKESGGRILTSGGRVLSVTGTGATLREAVDKAYDAVGKISFEKMFFRRDIAHRAFER